MGVDKVVPAGFAVLGIALIALWLRSGEVSGLQMRAPEPRKAPEQLAPAKPIAETWTVTRAAAAKSITPGSWPRFRGAKADAISATEPELARSWGEKGPPVLWTIRLGEGHAGAAIHDGRVFLLDYDEAAHRDTLRVLSFDTGAEIWRASYPANVPRFYGMSRTVPAITDKHIVSLGPLCHVTCADTETGALRWALDLPREFAIRVPSWYAGQCPLVDNGRAILAIGADDVLMMAVDCESGKPVWKTPNPKKWRMTHSSVIPMDFAGRRMFVYCATGGIVGVDADDGRPLWETEDWRVDFANIPAPVPLGDGRIFLAGGYGAGSRMLRLKQAGDKFVAETVFTLEQSIFGAEQQTPIFYGGNIYGISAGDEQLVCLDPSGKVLWRSGREKRFGRGPFIIANGLLYVMDNYGTLTLVEASPGSYRELARAKVLPGRDSWAPMAIAAGRLIARDLNTMVCLDVRNNP